LLSVGAFLVVAGALEGNGFFANAIVHFELCPLPRGDGEWARFRWQNQGKRLEIRGKLTRAVRHWFDTERFIEVHTPTLLEAPGLDSGVDALSAELGYLVTSPELHMKRLLVGGMPRIYQLATCFRRDERGRHHQPEFTMLEWYRAFCDLPQVLKDTESIILALMTSLELGETLTVRGRTISFERPFLRMAVADAFRRYVGDVDVARIAQFEPERYFELLVDRVEPALAESERPVFLTRYPASQAALSRRCFDDPRFGERAELYVAGIELCNAYGELNDAVEQRRRFEEELTSRRTEGKTEYPLDEPFLQALVEGMPPSAGNALGLDRLMMLLQGQDSIAETIAFPR
jgi:lysyl-tRNA synthetase class 2